MIAQWIQVLLEELGIAGILAGVGGLLVARYLRSRDQKAEERAESLREESILNLRGHKLTGSCFNALTTAIKTQTPNGEVDEANAAYQEYCAELDEYLLKQNANANH